MRLNDLKPANGSKASRFRVGRGIGSGAGKTSGRGHKGQHARSGGYHKTGFEGGQMPLQRRLPRVGFRSRISDYRSELRLDQLNKVEGEEISLAVLKAHKVVSRHATRVKIICTGKLGRAITIKASTELRVTAQARAAVEAAGGRVEEAE